MPLNLQRESKGAACHTMMIKKLTERQDTDLKLVRTCSTLPFVVPENLKYKTKAERDEHRPVKSDKDTRQVLH